MTTTVLMSREHYRDILALSLWERHILSWEDAVKMADINLDAALRVVQEQADKRILEVLALMGEDPLRRASGRFSGREAT